MNKFFMGTVIAIIVSFFIFSGSVSADEYEPDQDEILTEETSEFIITDVPEVASELPETISTPDENYLLKIYSMNNLLRSELDQAADAQSFDLVYPDDFDSNVIAAYDLILTNTINPVVFRDTFVDLVLSYLGLIPDHPLYDYFRNTLLKYYDDVTGLTQQQEQSTALTLGICILGSVSLFGIVKWVI